MGNCENKGKIFLSTIPKILWFKSQITWVDSACMNFLMCFKNGEKMQATLLGNIHQIGKN